MILIVLLKKKIKFLKMKILTKKIQQLNYLLEKKGFKEYKED